MIGRGSHLLLLWGAGQRRDPVACTIEESSLSLDSLPGHTPPALSAQGPLQGEAVVTAPSIAVHSAAAQQVLW